VSLDTIRGLRRQRGVAGCVVYHPREGRFTVLIERRISDSDEAFARFTAARGVWPSCAPSSDHAGDLLAR